MVDYVEVVEVGIMGPTGAPGAKGDTGATGTGAIPSVVFPTITTTKAGIQAAIDSALPGYQIVLGDVVNYDGGSGTRLTIGDDKIFLGGRITSSFSHDEPTINLQGSRITINGTEIDVAFATAVQVASGNAANQILITNARITAQNGYCILDNNTNAASNDMIIANSFLTSFTADAVEFNHPTTNATNRLLWGCILDAQGVPPSGSAGFPIGIAGVQGCVAGGCIIKNGRAAIHIEDYTNRLVMGMISGSDFKQGGFTVQIPVSSKGYPAPGVYGLLNLRHTGTIIGFNGFTTIGDNNGNVDQISCVASVFDGFDYGFGIADTCSAYLDGNIVLNGNNVIFGAKHAEVFGIINSKNVPSMMVGQSAASFGGVNSNTTVTTILTKNGSNFPGPDTEFWGQPSASFTHPGTGTPQFTICALPTRFLGYLSVKVEGSPRGFQWFGKVKWDGTTLTVGGPDGTDKIEQYNGAISAFVPSSDGAGNLQFTFFTNTSMTNIFRIRFGKKACWLQF